MGRRFSFVLLVIFGSFCVYCAQNVVGGGNGGNGNGSGGSGGGMVGNAGADTCCTPPDPPPGTVLFDQKFAPADCLSPAIDVAGYRTIVVHGSAPWIEWSFGGAAGWATDTTVANQTQDVRVLDGRLGKQLRISYGSPCAQQAALTVVGYKQ